MWQLSKHFRLCLPPGRSWRKGEWPGSSLKEMAKFRGAHSSKPLLAPHLAPHDTRANCLSSATSSASSRGRLVTECRCESCAQERRRQLMTSSPLPDTWLRNGPTGVVREECRRFGHKHLLPGDVKRCCFFHSCWRLWGFHRQGIKFVCFCVCVRVRERSSKKDECQSD